MPRQESSREDVLAADFCRHARQRPFARLCRWRNPAASANLQGCSGTGTALPGSWLPVERLHTVWQAHPIVTTPCPNLALRGAQFLPLLQSADPQRVGLRILERTGIQRTPADFAKRKQALVAAGGRLGVGAGLPLISRKPSAGAAMFAQKAEPDWAWQSAQWQTVVVPGCTCASYSMAPQ